MIYHYMGIKLAKTVFVGSDKVRPKPVCPAIESSKNEILLVVSLDMILFRLLIRLGRCAGWSIPVLFANPKDRFFCVEAKNMIFLISMQI